MKIIISLILCFSALTQEIQSIGRTKNNNLILRSNSCEYLVNQHQAICDWKQSINKNFIAPTITRQSCKLNSRKQNYAIVSSCLPDFIKLNHSKKLYQNGANCWGTAMSFKGISNKPRFIWEKEMQYFVESPLCRKLEVGEKKEAGDIINVYGAEYISTPEKADKGSELWDVLYPGRHKSLDISHGYTGYNSFLHSDTYLTDDLAFGKDSPNKDDRFLIHKLKETYGRPRIEECQEVQSMDPYLREYDLKPLKIKSKKCGYFSLAYRCKSLDSYLSEESLSQQDELILAEIEDLKKRQDHLFSLMRTPNKKMSKAEIKDIVESADRISDDVLKTLKDESLSKKTEFLLVLKYFSAEGLRKSLELAYLVDATETI